MMAHFSPWRPSEKLIHCHIYFHPDLHFLPRPGIGGGSVFIYFSVNLNEVSLCWGIFIGQKTFVPCRSLHQEQTVTCYASRCVLWKFRGGESSENATCCLCRHSICVSNLQFCWSSLSLACVTDVVHFGHTGVIYFKVEIIVTCSCFCCTQDTLAVFVFGHHTNTVFTPCCTSTSLSMISMIQFLKSCAWSLSLFSVRSTSLAVHHWTLILRWNENSTAGAPLSAQSVNSLKPPVTHRIELFILQTWTSERVNERVASGPARGVVMWREHRCNPINHKVTTDVMDIHVFTSFGRWTLEWLHSSRLMQQFDLLMVFLGLLVLTLHMTADNSSPHEPCLMTSCNPASVSVSQHSFKRPVVR